MHENKGIKKKKNVSIEYTSNMCPSNRMLAKPLSSIYLNNVLKFKNIQQDWDLNAFIIKQLFIYKTRSNQTLR